MRFAIVSDIHANAQAWEVVARDIREQSVDLVICLGDVVGYGPRPQEVLDAVRETTPNILLGNHDAVPGGQMTSESFNDRARAIIDWTCDQLDPESRHFLSTLPYVIEEPGGNILFTHAEVRSPESWRYINDEESARRNFDACKEQVVFFGHSHKPGIFVLNRRGGIEEIDAGALQIEKGQRYLVNPGSVGDPRETDVRASYCVFDSDLQSLLFRQLPFDAEGYRADLAAAGLDSKPWFLCYLDGETEHGAPDLAISTPPRIERRNPAGNTGRVTLQSAAPGPAGSEEVLEAQRQAVAQAKEEYAANQAAHDLERGSNRNLIMAIAATATLVIGVGIWGVLSLMNRKDGGSTGTAGTGESLDLPDPIAMPDDRRSDDPDPDTTADPDPAENPDPPEPLVVESPKPWWDTNEKSLRFDGDFTVVVDFESTGDGTLFARCFRDGNWSRHQKALYLKDGKLQYSVHSAADITTDIPLNDGLPHRVLLVQKEGRVEIIVNGQSRADREGMARPDPQFSVTRIGIGAKNLGGEFPGTIHKFRYWDRALDAGEIATMATGSGEATDSLLAWTGPGAKPFVPRIAETTPDPDPPKPEVTPADQDPDWLASGDPAFNLGGDFTIAARFETKGEGVILAKTPPDGWIQHAKGIFVRSGKVHYDVGWVGQLSGGPRVDDGKPHEVVVIASRGAAELFLDGVSIARAPKLTHPDPEGFLFRIGHAADNDQSGHIPNSFKEGKVHEVRFWQRTLTDAERDSLLGGSPEPPEADFLWPIPPPEPEPEPKSPVELAYEGAVEALLEYKFPEALAALEPDGVTDAGLASSRALLQQASTLNAFVLATFEPEVGKILTIETTTGPLNVEITEVLPDRLKAVQLLKRGAGTAKLPVELQVSQLARKEFLARAAGAGQAPLDLYHGMKALRLNRPDLAIEFFDKLDSEFGATLTRVVGSRNDSRDKEAATAAWASLRESAARVSNKSEAEQVLALVEKFRDRHGESAFLESIRDPLDALVNRVRRAAAENLVLNGDFESGETASWELEFSDPMATSTMEIAESTRGNGGSILKIVPGEDKPEAAPVLAQPIPLSAGGIYRLSLWARCSQQNSAFQIQVGGEMFLRKFTGTHEALNTWQHYDLFIQPRSDDPVLRIRFFKLDRNKPCPGELDDVVIEAFQIPLGRKKEDLEYAGHAYRYFETPATYQTATAICTALGGHLLTLESAEESKKVLGHWDATKPLEPPLPNPMPDPLRILLGLAHLKDSEYHWVTDEPLDFTNWSPTFATQPDKMGENIILVLDKDRKWHHGKRNRAYGFICEWDK